MNFPFTTVPAAFVERPNRFRIVARLPDGTRIDAHCPNPGRLCELLVPGATVHVSRADATSTTARRKTAYDLRFAEHPQNGELVSLDTRLPNQLFAEGVEAHHFAPFRSVASIEQEVALPGAHDGVHSRIDFRLLDAARTACWVEVKSVTLVEMRCARFPDAPTTRGRRHVSELVQRVQAGERAAVVFIVQRPDADQLRPQWDTDPAFARALVDAHTAGVEVYAYTCTITLAAARLARQIPVVLTPQSSALS